jgi:large subunit ribosomal protein L3
MKALITYKLGMTSMIGEDGVVTPVTLLNASSNVVLGKRTIEKDGSSALILGAGNSKKQSKPVAGMLKAAQASSSLIKEIRLDDAEMNELNVGDKLNADVFSVGDIVAVSGTTKGKGWAGTIKRHGFHRGRKTHGGGSYRRVGSIGSMYPQHIRKGKRMAGRMGHVNVTTRGLKIAYINNVDNAIGVVGAVPGPNKGVVLLRGDIIS